MSVKPAEQPWEVQDRYGGQMFMPFDTTFISWLWKLRKLFKDFGTILTPMFYLELNLSTSLRITNTYASGRKRAKETLKVRNLDF